MIYVGRKYTSNVQGAKLKAAQCENCGCVYAYIQHNTAAGAGSSPYFLDNEGAERRATEAAVRNLQEALNKDEPAPCPTCGWLQPGMVRHMRSSRGTWLLVLAVLAGIGAGIALLVEPFHAWTLIV